MSGNEEADATAGTPDEGKKLTFAERRELERKKKEEEARDAGAVSYTHLTLPTILRV